MATSAGRVVELSQAIDPLVLAVDIDSTASRGDVSDAADARSRAEGSSSPPVITPPQR
jgi:hypothetical protein